MARRCGFRIVSHNYRYNMEGVSMLAYSAITIAFAAAVIDSFMSLIAVYQKRHTAAEKMATSSCALAEKDIDHDRNSRLLHALEMQDVCTKIKEVLELEIGNQKDIQDVCIRLNAFMVAGRDKQPLGEGIVEEPVIA